jgi:hypothetical protein
MIVTNDPRQMQLDHTASNPAGLARKLAAAPLKPRKPQAPCDVGLFSDEADQLDLVSLFRDR